MTVSISKRREIADKMRAAMGAPGAVEIDGIPLADLIEPEECDGCEPGAWEVVAMKVAERLGVVVGGCLPSGYADAIGEALDRRLMPEGYKWPRFEDGEPVRLGDVGLDAHNRKRVAYGVKLTRGGFVFVSDDMGDTWWANDSGPLEDVETDDGKRVRRPDERRDVARRMRTNSGGDWEWVVPWAVFNDAEEHDAAEVLSRLADLIDPTGAHGEDA